MADLHKFIRQQFSDNNWAKECDISNISVEKLKEISELFCQLSIKSKLNIILTYCNSTIPSDPDVAKYVESVTLQALDEEDNFVRAVATILHSRQTFGHLTFDISETNESFAKTLEKLSAYQLSDSPTSRVPLLASMLDTRITNAALAKSTVMPVENEINGTCLNTSCGFTMRDKSPALRMKETYLDRLQEECERRRIHVPIPGRSFGKQDSGDDSSLDGHHSHQHDDHRNSTELAPSVPNRRAPSFPRRASVARKADIGEGLPEATATSSGGLSARARLLSMHNRAQMGPNGPNGSALRRPFPPTAGDRGPFHRLSSGAAGSSAANKRRTTGIKLLDFEELPATGLQAKKLRKEQQEKEREAKKREREERARERREARDNARQARLRELANAAVAVANNNTTTVKHAAPTIASAPSTTPSLTPATLGGQQHPWTQPFVVLAPGQQPQQPQRTFPHHIPPLPPHQDDDDDDLEEDDDDDEDENAFRGPDGAFHLTAPRGFRGFNQQHVMATTTRPTTPQQTTFILQAQQLRPGQPFIPTAQLVGHQSQQQPAAPAFSAPRIRFIRPMVAPTAATAGAPTATAVAPRMVATADGTDGVGGVHTTGPTAARFVQLPDGTFALTTANPAAAAGTTTNPVQQGQQQTVYITTPGTTQIRMAAPSQPVAGVTPTRLPTSPPAVAAATTTLPTNNNTAATTNNPPQAAPTPGNTLLIARPTLTPQTLVVSPIQIAPGGSGQPQQQPAAAPAVRLQPRLIQIRPRLVTPPSQQGIPSTSPAGTNPSTATTVTILPVQAQQQQQQPVQQPQLMTIVPRPTAAATEGSGGPAAVPTSPPAVAATAAAAPPRPRQEVNLTPTQCLSIQSIFAGANRLTRPDKALILSFMTGQGVNPHPESGNVHRIRVSEYREHVKDAVSGRIMEVAADTFLLLDYATGKFERVKAYRSMPPDQLLQVPLANAAATSPAAAAATPAQGAP